MKVATRQGCTRGEFAIQLGTTGKVAMFCHVNSETEADADAVVAAINREEETGDGEGAGEDGADR